MDVTQQINNYKNGFSTFTNPSFAAATKSLNAAQGPSIDRPIVERITAMPLSLGYKDAVGLFGSENKFIRLDINIQNTLFHMFSGEYKQADNYFIYNITRQTQEYEHYEEALDTSTINEESIVNGYKHADYNTKLENNEGIMLSVELINNKTGNKYNDNWLDVVLYSSSKQALPSNTVYVKPQDTLYIGLHARNTRRLPYNIKVNIAETLISTVDVINQKLLVNS